MKQIISYAPSLREALQAFLKDQGRGNTAAWAADFYERFLPYASQGKLLRGGLACFSYETFSGVPPCRDVIRMALALEVAHSALLIHDDVMDGDDLRRGQAAMHRQYEASAVQAGWRNPAGYGVNMALCAGDAAFFLAAELIRSVAGDPKANEAHRLFNEQLLTTCFGQMQDIASEGSAEMPAKRQIYTLMRTKTAAYTISLPLIAGATLAGQPPSTINNLRAIGDNAGVIYQIRDDELGIMGNPQQTGKPAGADIREGKRTLLYYYLMKQCGAVDRRRLREVFGNPDCSAEDIAYVRQLIKKLRITGLIDKDIAHFKKRALAAINRLEAPAAAKTELRSLVAFCGRRQA